MPFVLKLKKILVFDSLSYTSLYLNELSVLYSKKCIFNFNLCLKGTNHEREHKQLSTFQHWIEAFICLKHILPFKFHFCDFLDVNHMLSFLFKIWPSWSSSYNWEDSSENRPAGQTSPDGRSNAGQQQGSTGQVQYQFGPRRSGDIASYVLLGYVQ